MTGLTRRAALASGMALAALARPLVAQAAVAPRPRMRVISDNDFSGDPDGLFQLAHHLLCRSIALPLVVGSHLVGNSAWGSRQQATDAANQVRELLGVMGPAALPTTVLAGAEQAIAARNAWKPGPATAAIVREAMRTDTDLPLYYVAGASLTEIALAWLAEPRIGRRLRLVWIGGNEHAGLAEPPPGPREPEFNFGLDPVAAKVIFDESDIEIWQVPRNAYRQMLFSVAELDELAATGPIGAWLKGRVDALEDMFARLPIGKRFRMGETYVLGDSPLVTLTALQTPFQPDAASSSYRTLPTPRINPDGSYTARSDGRPMRVYSSIDAGATFRDMMAKLRLARPKPSRYHFTSPQKRRFA